MTFTGGGTWVFKRFRIPTKDRCTTINGFDTQTATHGFMVGTACTEGLTGATMKIHYTTHGGSDFYFETAMCQFFFEQTSAGATPGVCVGQYLQYPDNRGRFTQQVTLRRCDVKVPY